MFAAPVVAAPVGIFDFQEDVKRAANDPLAIGITSYMYQDRYLITAGGWDIWGDADAFHYAYNEVSGDIRIEARLNWQDAGWNDWAKMGVMLRESLDAGSIHYSTDHRKGGGNPWEKENTTGDPSIFAQWRDNTGGGSGGQDFWDWLPDNTSDPLLGVQRVNFGPMDIIQHIADRGSGWELLRTTLRPALNNDLLAGVCVTSHDNAWAVQAWAWDVAYTENPDLIDYEIVTVPEDAAVEQCDTDIPGFHIRSEKVDFENPPPSWDYVGMNWLLDTVGGGVEEGSRIDLVVNVRDSGDGWVGDNRSFPGIDTYQYPAADPADGDDDDYFATEIIGCIELQAGPFIMGIASDDGAQVEIGGVFVGQTTEWKGASMEYILFNVAAAGKYSLRVRTLEGGGGSSIELWEVLADGTHVLMNDVAAGASPVYVPEPATIALLGFGGLAMLRVRKRK
jgi:hypothetical protein